MSYTNVTIPEYYDTVHTLMDRIKVLELEKKMELQKREALEKILHNIPEAVKEWGYVDIEYGNEKITLVEKTLTPPKQDKENRDE